jgi:AICAR transformylase/IMP cyclohydrolase PurH
MNRVKTLQLKYDCNPHQSYGAIEPLDPTRSPIRLLNGMPSFINVLDALNAWQTPARGAYRDRARGCGVVQTHLSARRRG